MKKRNLLIGALTITAAITCALGLAACNGDDGKDKDKDKDKDPTERITFSESTNPYSEKTWEDYGDTEQFDWTDMRASAPIYYQFEGSYSEAYQGDYSRTFLFMNCYENGLIHATYGSENYYGYWTNIDRRGNNNLVLHIVRYNNKEYNDGAYESVCDTYAHDYYEYASTIIWNQWGTRTVLIYGYHYTPVKSITVDTTEATTDYLEADSFNYTGIHVRLTRENGKTVVVDEQELPLNYSRVKFTGYDLNTTGEQTVTATFAESDKTATATFKINVYEATEISLNTDGVQKDYYIGDAYSNANLVVNAKRSDNKTVSVALNRCQFSGFESGTKGEQTITVTFLEKTATYKVNVAEPTFTGKITYNNQEVDATITINTLTDCTVQFSGKTVHSKYTRLSAGGKYFYTLTDLADTNPGIEAEDWAKVYKQYECNAATLKLSKAAVYSVTGEVMTSLGSGWLPNSTNRILIVDEANGEAMVSYSYSSFFGSTTETFVVKCSIAGNQLTVTELIEGPSSWFTGYDSLVKSYTLNGDFTADVNS